MTTYLRRYYSNPGVMVPWCEQVGLDPERVPVSGFSIEHEGDLHVAVYELAPALPADFVPGKERHRLVVDVLPFPCKLHPDVPAIGAANGLEVDGDD